MSVMTAPAVPATAAGVVADDLARICADLGPRAARLYGTKVLITGGAGFLGYYLVGVLGALNAARESAPAIEVVVYDNFARGVPQWLTEQAAADEHLTLVRHDITDPLPADLGHVDWVIHAASIASPIYYRLHPIETMDANVHGLRILLDHIRRQAEAGDPASGFLYFSTSEIYGDPDPANIPTPETYRGNVSCTGPRACYDESKRYGETLCVNFARQHGLPIGIARPFNNYGPGLKITDGRVLPDFVRDVLAGRDIVMLSDGAPTRTFCYISDAITGYFQILLSASDRPGEPYNIGVETPEISMADLADRVVDVASELFGYAGSVVRRVSTDADYLTDNPNRRCPVIAKARTELGYDPKVDIDEGLRRALTWYREHNVAEEA